MKQTIVTQRNGGPSESTTNLLSSPSNMLYKRQSEWNRSGTGPQSGKPPSRQSRRNISTSSAGGTAAKRKSVQK